MEDAGPVADEKAYALASHNDDLEYKEDGLAMFSDNVIPQDKFMLDNQVLITYITEGRRSVVGKEYTGPYAQGCIVIVDNE